jgi:hypothetical protein
MCWRSFPIGAGNFRKIFKMAIMGKSGAGGKIIIKTL